MKKDNQSNYILLTVIMTVILTVIWVFVLNWMIGILEGNNSSCQKQIEEVKIECEAHQSTYEMDYRTCEMRLGEALEMNEYLKKRIKGFIEQ